MKKILNIKKKKYVKSVKLMNYGRILKRSTIILKNLLPLKNKYKCIKAMTEIIIIKKWLLKSQNSSDI